jgi:hypothetical protein
MPRFRLALVFGLMFFVLGVAPAIAQEEMTGDNAPAVVIEEDSAAIEEAAWTFRFLIPTLLGITGLAVVGVGLGYVVRVRGRYRVVQ